MPEADPASAWASYADTLTSLQRELDAAAPDDRARGEGARYLARVSVATLERMFDPEWRTVDGLYYGALKIAGANPDYRMAQAGLDPAARYELSGCLHDAQSVGVGLYSPLPGGGLDLDGYLRVGQSGVATDESGRFRVSIGGADADLALGPRSALLMTRELYKQSGASPAELRLRRIDQTRVAIASLPSLESVTAQIRAAELQIAALVRRFLQWTRSFAGCVNALEPLDEELDRQMRGDPQTFYCSGSFDLAPGEALLIEIPATDAWYWAIQATNFWLEPLAGANLNDATAQRDADGVLRVCVTASSNTLANRLDTGGRTRGGLLYRTVGAAQRIVPKVQRIRAAPFSMASPGELA